MGRLPGAVATPIRLAAFLEFLRVVGPGTMCVIWPWAHRRDAYIRVSAEGGMRHAHRWVWVQLNGPVPDGYEVCHNCPGPEGDVQSCVRPSHLWLGTHSQNIQDAYAKGRMHGNTKNHPVGEAHHSTPLTAEDVYRIRRLGRTERGMQRRLATEYGITPAAINSILQRRSWRHLPEETNPQPPVVQA